MMKMLTTREALSNLFHLMTYLYDEKRFPNFSAVYQFILEEEAVTYKYYITIADDRAKYTEGKHGSPTITIHASVSVWFDLVSGRLNGYWGWLTKKFKVDGPIFYLKRFNEIFGKQFINNVDSNVEKRVQDFEVPRNRVWKKPNKVLIINGSPRMENGATYFYLKYLINGIKKSGVNVELIHLYDKNLGIESCKGCFSCWKSEIGKCVINDDFHSVKNKFIGAYLTIFAIPVFFDSRPSKVQAFIERLFICLPGIFTLSDKLTRHPVKNNDESYMALFAVNGFPEIEHFYPLVETFKANARNLHRPLVATILRPGAEFYIFSPYLRERLKSIITAIEKAGDELMHRGNISKKLISQISDDYGIDYDKWRNYTNLYWHLRATKKIKGNI